MHHNPDHRALLADAHRALRERITSQPTVPEPASHNPRRLKSLQHCHYPRQEPEYRSWRDTENYVPELSARIENDPNLTDGARRCARKIAEYAYRYHREDRRALITVSYLARALRRSTRSVQRYLRQLERSSYVRVGVAASGRTRMSIGLVVELLAPLFPRHRQKHWPVSAKSGVTRMSDKKRFLDSLYRGTAVIPREAWALRCMDGVFRVLIETLPPVSRAVP